MFLILLISFLQCAIAPLNMPFENAMQEGRWVIAVVEKYYDRLLQPDIKKEYLDTLPL